jgi:putative hydrolase of the HAD superfamily
MTSPKRPGAIFDADDTLWKTQYLYDEAKREFYDLVTSVRPLAESIGVARFTAADAERLIDKIDSANVAKWGFSADRFPRSLVQAYRALSVMAGVPAERRVERRLRGLAATIQDATPRLLDGTLTTLATLAHEAVYSLVLYSAGDRESQLRKLKKTGLDDVFAGHIHIVRHKNDAALAEVIRAEQLEIPRSWMIGNSLTTDINPALRVGLNCIWIDGEGWAYDYTERKEPGRVFHVSTLPEILGILFFHRHHAMETRLRREGPPA